MLRISPRSFLAWFWDLLFFDYFLSFSIFFIVFDIFPCFPFFGVGEGDVFPKYGVGRCFPIFRDGVGGVCWPIFGAGGWGWGFGGWGGFPPCRPY